MCSMLATRLLCGLPRLLAAPQPGSCCAGTEFDALLHDCDRLLEVRNAATALVQQSGECTRVYSDEDMEHAGRLAVKLLRFVVQRGCVGLAGYVFPIAFKPPQAADVQPRPGALSLLHLAVRSGSLRMVGPSPGTWHPLLPPGGASPRACCRPRGTGTSSIATRA